MCVVTENLYKVSRFIRINIFRGSVVPFVIPQQAPAWRCLTLIGTFIVTQRHWCNRDRCNYISELHCNSQPDLHQCTVRNQPHIAYSMQKMQLGATSTSSWFQSIENDFEIQALDSVGLIMSYNIHKLNWLLEASGDIDINTTEQSLVHI